MQDVQIRLDRLRSLLIRVVAGGLVLSYFIPGFFDGPQRTRAAEFVLFLHLFLPFWAWGCYSFMRSQWSDDLEIEPCCRKCGYDITGLVRDNCPECGARVRKTVEKDVRGDKEKAA